MLATLGKSQPTIHNLVDLLFGPRSRIGRLLAEKLTISEENLMKNIGTYFLAAAYNLSQVQIYSKHSFVSTEGLTKQKTYQSFWNSIAKSGCAVKGNPNVCGARPLWIDVKHALNETCRELFIEGVEFYMRVTIDDDKMHYEKIDKQAAQGLKIKKNSIEYFKCMQHAGRSPVTHHTTPSCRDWVTIDYKHTLQSIHSTPGRSAETYPTTLSHRDWDLPVHTYWSTGWDMNPQP
jgi:hypothetical protein